MAILGLNDYLPWQSARVCFQHQIDFNYLEARHLLEDAGIDEEGIHLAGMNYRVLITEIEPPEMIRPALRKLEKAGRVIRWDESMGDKVLLDSLAEVIDKDLTTSDPEKDLRCRHLYKLGAHFYILFNEGEKTIENSVDFSVKGERFILDPKSGDMRPMRHSSLQLAPHQASVVMIRPG